MGPYLSPVECRSVLLHVIRVHIALWRGHLSQGPGTTREHERSCPGADQDQPPAAPGVLKGKLLGERTPPGDTQRIDLPVAQLIKHLRHQPGMLRKTVGNERGR